MRKFDSIGLTFVAPIAGQNPPSTFLVMRNGRRRRQIFECRVTGGDLIRGVEWGLLTADQSGCNETFGSPNPKHVYSTTPHAGH